MKTIAKPDIFDRKINPFLKFSFFILLAAFVASMAAGGCGRERPGMPLPLLLDVPSTFTFTSPAPAQATVELDLDGDVVAVVVPIGEGGLATLPVPAGKVTIIAPWGVSWHYRGSVDDVEEPVRLWAK